MTKQQQFQKDTMPVRDILRGWAFCTLQHRRARVAQARLALAQVPAYARAWCEREIEAVEAHCAHDGPPTFNV